DGRFVAYRSAADNLVPGDSNGVPDVFLYDRQTGNTTLLSVTSLGNFPGNDRSLQPVFSADGGTLVFRSWASDLIAQDYNQAGDLFAVTIAKSNLIQAVVGQLVFAPPSSRNPTITWLAQPGVAYRVEFTDQLSSPFWQNLIGN